MYAKTKSLFHIWALLALLLSVLGGALTTTPVHAAGIVVNTDTDPSGITGLLDGKCSLREAVSNANNDNQGYTDCAAGFGADTITFAATYTITLSSGQLTITSPITIDEASVNYTTLQASSCDPVTTSGCTPATWRVFEVGPTGSLTLDHIRVKFGRCAGACPTAGDAGGGILVNQGSLTMIDSSVVINSAAYGGGIYNSGGTIAMSELGDLERSFVTGNAATADGGGIYNDGGSITMSDTTVNGNDAGTTGSGGGVYLSGGVASLSNGTVEQNTAKYGGGMYFYNASGTLNNVYFHQNSSTSLSGAGGAMFNDQSNPTVQSSSFYMNRSVAGAAIYNLNSSPSISGTIFLSNTAPNGSKGGGIYNAGSNPSLTNVVFRSNEAGENNTGGQGGAIYNDASNPILQTVTFYSNHATGSGGGIYNTNGSAPTLTNATFAANSADGSGGGIYNQSSNGTLTNVTFSGNGAPFGGGLYNFSSNPNLTNVILWGDGAPSGGPELYNLFSTPVIDHSVVQGGCAAVTCTNIVTGDPVLGTLPTSPSASDTMSLGTGSSAIDMGTNTGCPATDQRAVTRPQGPQCDIGAHEAKYYNISGNVATADAALNYTVGSARTGFADATGDYSISVPEHWAGTVTPSKTICNFTPMNRSYSDVTSNQTSQNYTASCSPPPVTVSGNVGTGGALLSYDNDGPQTAMAAGDGAYSFNVPSGWSGTVTPSKMNCTFTPANRSYTSITSSQSGENYLATCTPVDEFFPSLTLSTNSLDFGSQSVGAASTPQTVTVTNSGTDNLILGVLGVSGDFGLTNDNCSGQTVAAGNFCTFEVLFQPASTGLKNGTVSISSNATSSPDSVNLSGTGVVTTTVSFTSVGRYDGFVLEKGENADIGGSAKALGSTFILGDNAYKKQYRAILHFNTAGLPDNAVITGLTLKLKKQGGSGTNPFTILGTLQVDISKPYFGTGIGLAASDFQAVAGASNVGSFDPTPMTGNWFNADLTSSAFPFLNLTGTTQFRLAFSLDDNNNSIADTVKFFSGNYSTASYRPVLNVTYYVP